MIYFVSGHRDLTRKEFEEHYVPKLKAAMKKNNRIIVGDCPGADQLTIEYLWRENYWKIMIYHIGHEPMYNPGFPCTNIWFSSTMIDSDFERDFLMTLNSHKDLLWIRNHNKQSGTRMNVYRREWLSEQSYKINIDDLNDLYARWYTHEDSGFYL